MIFHALEYAALLALTGVAWWLLPARWRWAVLVLGGAAFLLWAGPLHLGVVTALTLINFAGGLGLDRWRETARARWLLGALIVADVALLALFKYGPTLWSALGGGVVRDWLLPLGISYYAFQLIGYDLEVYWEREPVARHLGAFAAGIFFFPKLVAGPIERPHHFLAQLGAARAFAGEHVAAGVRQIGWGLFKKCVLADNIKLLIDPIHDAPAGHAGAALWLAALLYPLQIYNDFSGYTDIALGSARVLGLELQPNFNRPFAAWSVSEFWRRWHMSLSSWTNDYIYKPLSLMVRGSSLGLVLTVMITFAVLGAWHGPRATYLVFGLLHGTAVAGEVLWQRWRGRGARPLVPRWAAVALVYLFYSLTCVVFRAAHLRDAATFVARMVTTLPAAGGLAFLATYRVRLAALAGLFVAVAVGRWLATRRGGTLAERPAWLRWSLYYGVAAALVILGVFEAEGFVYEQF